MGIEISDETCDAERGGNRCGREGEFVIEVDGENTTYIACIEDVGRVMEQNEVESAYVERVY